MITETAIEIIDIVASVGSFSNGASTGLSRFSNMLKNLRFARKLGFQHMKTFGFQCFA